MKKSEIYHKAQLAILSSGFAPDEKLAIIKQLGEDEDFSLRTEAREAGAAAEAGCDC